MYKNRKFHPKTDDLSDDLEPALNTAVVLTATFHAGRSTLVTSGLLEI